MAPDFRSFGSGASASGQAQQDDNRTCDAHFIAIMDHGVQERRKGKREDGKREVKEKGGYMFPEHILSDLLPLTRSHPRLFTTSQ